LGPLARSEQSFVDAARVLDDALGMGAIVLFEVVLLAEVSVLNIGGLIERSGCLTSLGYVMEPN
jgi:hypothetical protein